MSGGFVRTVRGDVLPAQLGVTYMHEHLIIDSPTVADAWPHILLTDVSDAVAEVTACRAVGVGAMVDAMPMASGRGPERLARISQETGTHIVMATGLHTHKYYRSMPWVGDASVEQLADWFVEDIEVGADDDDHLGTTVSRTGRRAGIVKAATGSEGIDDFARKGFEAAAMASQATGAPMLTHCEEGQGGMEQIELLSSLGIAPSRVVVSHTDKVPDASYHTDLLESGASLEFDQALRQEASSATGTAQLLSEQVSRGFVDQLMLGTDGARRTLWTALGGRPGLAWLAGAYRSILDSVGIDRTAQAKMFEDNPQRFLTMQGPGVGNSRTERGSQEQRQHNESGDQQ